MTVVVLCNAYMMTPKRPQEAGIMQVGDGWALRIRLLASPPQCFYACNLRGC